MNIRGKQRRAGLRLGLACAAAFTAVVVGAAPAQADPVSPGAPAAAASRHGGTVVTSVTPSSGPPYAPTQITIRGSGFTPRARVLVGGVPAQLVRVLSPTEIVAWAPPTDLAGAETRTVPVRVLGRHPAGALAGSFTYAAWEECPVTQRDQVIRRGETLSSSCLGFAMAPGTTLTVQAGGTFFGIGTIPRLVAKAHGNLRPHISGWLWFGAADVKGALFGGAGATTQGQYSFGGEGRTVVRDSVFYGTVLRFSDSIVFRNNTILP